MNNIFVLDKNYNKIGTLSNQGVKPLAPYFNDLFVQDLETGADTYEFSTISNSYTQGCIEIGNHIMFAYRNRNELFTITSIEHSHNEGYKTVGVYAESVGFELLDIYMEKPKTSGSSGGTDNDNDGDDNYDDEYADVDDIYIDENGNIIYDKDGSGLGDVTIDGNGNIIYKPKNNKKYKDRPSDYLEFKNISYPTFIKMILKNTGWSCVCQPGLEKNKQDMRVSYDTNIYAILQDSMQDYKGVELEFRYEYNNGKVTKTVVAYNDGGRGSFIGKRFVYGQNVKGITKTQEVTHEKDDAIIFVDDIGVEVRYDVDFALKSAEVPEIEIGDTHYVIDSDFHPPMQIKARIGKIEVSFSDPTRNKIYLANNKKIKGSVLEDELEDYDDEDYDSDYDDGGDVSDHDHNCLRDYTEPSYVFLRHENLPDTWTCPFTDYEYTHRMYLEPDPSGETYSAIGGTYEPWNFVYANWVNCKRLSATDARSIISKNIENSIYVDSCGVRSSRYMIKMNNSEIENTTTMSTKDLYDFIKNLTICKYTNKVETSLLDDGNSYTFGIADADIHADSGNSVAGGIFRKLFNVSNDNPVRVGSGFIENSLLCALIGAFQQHIRAGGGGESGSGSNPDYDFDDIIEFLRAEHIRVETTNGQAASLNVNGVVYVTDLIRSNELIETKDLSVNTIKFSDGSTLTSANGSGSGGGTGGNTFDTITVRKIQGPDRGENQDKIVEFEDAIMVNRIGCYTGVIDITADTHVSMHSGLNVEGDVSVDGYVSSWNINGSSDKSLKENIRYIDAPTTYSVTHNDDLLEKADLYDFIVNQVNLCEYNFINDDREKIGFIANDYEGTKVGDKIVSRDGENGTFVYNINNLLFSIIGALQEEARIRDEKIATLEDRLARIEAMLGINNNDN